MRKLISIIILVSFISTSVNAPAYAQIAPDPMPRLPVPGVMVHLSPEFTPAYLKGIIINPKNALNFDFIVYKGDKLLSEDQKKVEYNKLIKYFLASLTIPDDDQWVNLSPYEKDRIIKDDFGKTEMGRDLLAEDYILKQITASLIYPKENLGKKFWDKVYAQAQKQFGSVNIPVNTFNKVWILPDHALVYEKGNAAYIINFHLKVMMEEDYLSLKKHSGITTVIPAKAGPQAGHSQELVIHKKNSINTIGSQIVREVILPELEHEINEGENFAPLRQVFSGVILAAWFKRALKQSLLGKMYANKAKIKGVDQDPKTNEIIYNRYLRAYKKGVFNYIKEDVDKYTNEVIPRKYFSGGAVVVTQAIKSPDEASLSQLNQDFALNSDNEDRASVALQIPEEKARVRQERDLSMTVVERLQNVDLTIPYLREALGIALTLIQRSEREALRDWLLMVSDKQYPVLRAFNRVFNLRYISDQNAVSEFEIASIDLINEIKDPVKKDEIEALIKQKQTNLFVFESASHKREAAKILLFAKNPNLTEYPSNRSLELGDSQEIIQRASLIEELNAYLSNVGTAKQKDNQRVDNIAKGSREIIVAAKEMLEAEINTLDIERLRPKLENLDTTLKVTSDGGSRIIVEQVGPISRELVFRSQKDKDALDKFAGVVSFKFSPQEEEVSRILDLRSVTDSTGQVNVSVLDSDQRTGPKTYQLQYRPLGILKPITLTVGRSFRSEEYWQYNFFVKIFTRVSTLIAQGQSQVADRFMHEIDSYFTQNHHYFGTGDVFLSWLDYSNHRAHMPDGLIALNDGDREVLLNSTKEASNFIFEPPSFLKRFEEISLAFGKISNKQLGETMARILREMLVKSSAIASSAAVEVRSFDDLRKLVQPAAIINRQEFSITMNIFLYQLFQALQNKNINLADIPVKSSTYHTDIFAKQASTSPVTVASKPVTGGVAPIDNQTKKVIPNQEGISPAVSTAIQNIRDAIGQAKTNLSGKVTYWDGSKDVVVAFKSTPSLDGSGHLLFYNESWQKVSIDINNIKRLDLAMTAVIEKIPDIIRNHQGAVVLVSDDNKWEDLKSRLLRMQKVYKRATRSNTGVLVVSRFNRRLIYVINGTTYSQMKGIQLNDPKHSTDIRAVMAANRGETIRHYWNRLRELSSSSGNPNGQPSDILGSFEGELVLFNNRNALYVNNQQPASITDFEKEGAARQVGNFLLRYYHILSLALAATTLYVGYPAWQRARENWLVQEAGDSKNPIELHQMISKYNQDHFLMSQVFDNPNLSYADKEIAVYADDNSSWVQIASNEGLSPEEYAVVAERAISTLNTEVLQKLKDNSAIPLDVRDQVSDALKVIVNQVATGTFYSTKILEQTAIEQNGDGTSNLWVRVGLPGNNNRWYTVRAAHRRFYAPPGFDPGSINVKVIRFLRDNKENWVQETNTQHSVSYNINGKQTHVNPFGGIDFTSANLNLKIKRDSNGVPLPVSQQDMAQLAEVDGLVPVILKIIPETASPSFSTLLTQ